MTLEIGTTSNAPIDVGNIIFDETYTLRWIDRTEPKEEPKYEEPDKMQVRFRCEFEIINHQPEPGDPDLNGQRVADFFTVSLHEKANFGQVVRAMLGMAPDAKFNDPAFDVDSLCASKNPAGNAGTFRATIRRKTTGYPKIENPLPVRQRNAAAGTGNEALAATAAGAPALGQPPF